MSPLRVFIGYDPREEVAFQVAAASIWRRASVPVAITPVNLRVLSRWFEREWDAKQSNEFTYTRFLVPWLTNYAGYALWMDCDVLVLGDVAEFMRYQDDGKAVWCVQHDYQPKNKVKYLGNVQNAYPRKNWSSVMWLNCGHEACRTLTPKSVARATGAYLHRMEWCAPGEVGALPPAWNHLVGEYEPNPYAKLAHYTIGGPYFPNYDGNEFSDEWWNELGLSLHAETANLRANVGALRAISSGGAVAIIGDDEIIDASRETKRVWVDQTGQA